MPGAITATRVTEIYISITLLGKMTLTLHIPGGIIRAIPLNLSPRNLQLLAYLAWKRSTGVRRDLLLEQIWGHGRTGEEATNEKLGEAFNNAKKYHLNFPGKENLWATVDGPCILEVC
jgi:hypothetical protein